MHSRTVARFGIVLGAAVLVDQTYLVFFTGIFPAALKVALLGVFLFLAILALLRWRYFANVLARVPSRPLNA